MRHARVYSCVTYLCTDCKKEREYELRVPEEQSRDERLAGRRGQLYGTPARYAAVCCAQRRGASRRTRATPLAARHITQACQHKSTPSQTWKMRTRTTYDAPTMSALKLRSHDSVGDVRTACERIAAHESPVATMVTMTKKTYAASESVRSTRAESIEAGAWWPTLARGSIHAPATLWRSGACQISAQL